MKKEADSQDLLSFESCRSSAVDHVEEMSLESARKMQDEQEVMSETPGNSTRGRGEDAWRLRKPKFFWNRVEGVPGYPDGEGHHEREQVKSSRRESEAPGEEGDEVKSPKRKVIQVESVEAHDCVKEANDMNQEKAEEKSFVPSAISVPQRPSFRCDNPCSEKTLTLWQFASVGNRARPSYASNATTSLWRQKETNH